MDLSIFIGDQGIVEELCEDPSKTKEAEILLYYIERQIFLKLLFFLVKTVLHLFNMYLNTY